MGHRSLGEATTLDRDPASTIQLLAIAWFFSPMGVLWLPGASVSVVLVTQLAIFLVAYAASRPRSGVGRFRPVVPKGAEYAVDGVGVRLRYPPASVFNAAIALWVAGMTASAFASALWEGPPGLHDVWLFRPILLWADLLVSVGLVTAPAYLLGKRLRHVTVRVSRGRIEVLRMSGLHRTALNNAVVELRSDTVRVGSQRIDVASLTPGERLGMVALIEAADAGEPSSDSCDLDPELSSLVRRVRSMDPPVKVHPS